MLTITPMVYRTDVYLILRDLRDGVPLCGDTPENIAIGILRGELDVLLGYTDVNTLEGFCVYKVTGNSCFVYALYAPGLGWTHKKLFLAYLRDRGVSKFRWASKVNEKVWTTLAPGAVKLWTVWEWSNPD